ncbi:uncharacterized protein LOC128240514 [Mya arenaria]|uniref:uncharacterized protein LOC128240514 n=1 Tax=Mya arenaria TaxID=6604 RepID=UPI0022DFB883|nr:uncharacterized protein LOC128240514 [Mya arenaria]
MPCLLCVSDSKNARALPECHHAICDDCLTEYISASFDRDTSTVKETQTILKCPQCTMQFKGPDFRASISEWIDKLLILSCKPSTINFSEHDPTKSATDHVKNILCDGVNKMYTPNGPHYHSVDVENQVSGKTRYRRHPLDVNSDCYKLCSTHCCKNVEFYCITHEELICRLCVIREIRHRQCYNIVDFEDASDIIQKSQIHKTVLSDLEAVMKHDVTLIREIDDTRKASEGQRSEIEKTFEAVRQTALHFIDVQEKICLKTFDEAMNYQAKRLNEIKGKIKAGKEATKLMAAELSDIIESGETSSYLFPSVLKIVRHNDENKINTCGNYIQCTTAKLKFQSTEAANTGNGFHGIQIAFENKETPLSPMPGFQATTENLLRLVAVNRQASPKTPQCVQVTTRDCQTDTGVKQPSQTKAKKRKTKGNVQNTKPMVKDANKAVTELKKESSNERHKQHNTNVTECTKYEVAELEVAHSIRDSKAIKNQHNTNIPSFKSKSSATPMFPNTNQGRVSDVLFLKNGQIIFSETFNSRLVITKDDLSYIFQLRLDFPPGIMAIRDNGSILVCKKTTNVLAVVNVHDGAALTIESLITLPWPWHPKNINSLCNGDILVSMKARDSKWTLSKLQLHDEDTFKSITSIKKPIDDGYSLHVCSNQTGSSLVIHCCESAGIVNAFDLDGNEKFSYKCDKPEAATHDRYGYIYILSLTGEIHILKSDGTRFGLKHYKDMQRCKNIVYDESKDRLIITTYRDRRIHLLKIDYINA